MRSRKWPLNARPGRPQNMDQATRGLGGQWLEGDRPMWSQEDPALHFQLVIESWVSLGILCPKVLCVCI